MGMVHVVRARAQGYAHRYTFATFLGRFGHLTAGLTPSPAVTDELSRRYVGHNSVTDTCLIRQLPYTAGTSGTAPPTSGVRWSLYSPGWSQHPC